MYHVPAHKNVEHPAAQLTGPLGGENRLHSLIESPVDSLKRAWEMRQQAAVMRGTAPYSRYHAKSMLAYLGRDAESAVNYRIALGIHGRADQLEEQANELFAKAYKAIPGWYR